MKEGYVDRYPVQVLEEMAKVGHETFLERVGHCHEQVRYLREVGLTEEQADKWAVSLGFHPGTVWPQWWDIEVLSDAELDFLESTKFCVECQSRHPKTEFGKSKRYKDGLSNRCKRFVNERNRQYRAAAKEHDPAAPRRRVRQDFRHPNPKQPEKIRTAHSSASPALASTTDGTPRKRNCRWEGCTLHGNQYTGFCKKHASRMRHRIKRTKLNHG